jgi:coniferyl-aldehyde dehydrogenase
LFAERYPDINAADYTSIIDQRSYDRLRAALDDARAKGAKLIDLAEGQKPDASMRKFPPHLVLNPTTDMELMRREIFGPILPLRLYDRPEEVVEFINAGDRPLAIYPFTRDASTRDFYVLRAMSGGVSVNDAMLHNAQHDMPFGGVGASGMGHYHGREGFDAFSKLRPIFQQGPLSAVQLFFQPPYSRFSRRLIDFMNQDEELSGRKSGHPAALPGAGAIPGVRATRRETSGPARTSRALGSHQRSRRSSGLRSSHRP